MHEAPCSLVSAPYSTRGAMRPAGWVVDDHDVPFSYLAADRLEVPGKRALEEGTLPAPELTSVAG